MPYALVPQKKVTAFEERIAPQIPDEVSWVGTLLADGSYLIWALGVTEDDIPRRFRITFDEAATLFPQLPRWTLNGVYPSPDN